MKNVISIAGQGKEGNHIFYIHKSSIAYIEKVPDNGTLTDYKIVLNNGKTFERKEGFKDLIEWFEK